MSQIYCSRKEVAERGERWDWSRQLLDRDGESPGFGGQRFLCFLVEVHNHEKWNMAGTQKSRKIEIQKIIL